MPRFKYTTLAITYRAGSSQKIAFAPEARALKIKFITIFKLLLPKYESLCQ